MQNSAFISLYAVFRDAAPDSLLTVLGFYEPFFWLLDIAIITPMLLSPACRTIVHSASSHQSGSGYRRPGTPGTSSMARMPKTGAVKRWIGRADAVIPGRNHPAPTLTRDGDCLVLLLSSLLLLFIYLFFYIHTTLVINYSCYFVLRLQSLFCFAQ
jgi:hypothetical protein